MNVIMKFEFINQKKNVFKKNYKKKKKYFKT